jgi:hypothetical protein
MSLILLLAILPQPIGQQHHYDHVEVNQIHYWNTSEEAWTPQFRQILFIDYVRIRGVDVMVVNDWRLYKDNMTPRKDFATGKYVLRFVDRGEKYREVYADSASWTDTDHDPEFLNREVWPTEKRRLLERASITKEKP